MTTVYFRGARGTPELPLRAAARERYGFPEERLAAGGALQVPALGGAQTLAKIVNDARDARRYPESAVRAGELYAAALVQEMLRLIVAHYLSAHPDAIARAYKQLETDLGPDLSATLARYIAVFQPKLVARGEVTPDVYLTGEQEGLSNKQVAVESLILLHFANVNPALGRLRDLFDDSELQETRYPDLVTGLEAFFAGEPDAGEGQKLFDLLRAPINASPTSLEGQLGGLRGQLGALGLGGLEGLTMSGLDELEGELLRAGDTLREEQKPNFGGGPGPAEVFDPAASLQAGGAGAAPSADPAPAAAPAAFSPEHCGRGALADRVRQVVCVQVLTALQAAPSSEAWHGTLQAWRSARLGCAAGLRPLPVLAPQAVSTTRAVSDVLEAST